MILTKGRPKRQMSEIMDQIMVVRFEMVKRVAPYLFMKNGMME